MIEPLPRRAAPAPVRRPPPKRRLRRAVLRWLVRLVLTAAVFAGGVALGEALHDNPKPTGDVTVVRTLRPLPLAPAPETVTVTTPGGR